jgi:hypothetical protein
VRAGTALPPPIPIAALLVMPGFETVHAVVIAAATMITVTVTILRISSSSRFRSMSFRLWERLLQAPCMLWNYSFWPEAANNQFATAPG